MAAELRKQYPVRTALGRLLGVHNSERAWRLGAKGEQLVGKTLAGLPSDWAVAHDVTISQSGTNVDHLVIGPAGAFSLNSKYLNAKVWVAERAVMVNGQRTDFLAKSRAEARTVSAALTKAVGWRVDVRPVLVMMCDRLTVKSQPVDVEVITRRALLGWLARQPATMSLEAVADLHRAAQRQATWLTERGRG